MKIINYLGINLIKKMKDLYTENCKTLFKKLKKTQRNGKIFCAHGLEELTLLKYPYYLKQSTDSIQSLLNPSDIFHRNRTKNPKNYVEPQKTLYNQGNTWRGRGWRQS